MQLTATAALGRRSPAVRYVEGMDTNCAALLSEHPAWALLLRAYQQAEADGRGLVTLAAADRLAAAERPVAATGEAAESAGGHAAPHNESAGPAAAPEPPARGTKWLRRLREAPGISPVELASIHGRLIAEGLLQFELGSRDDGVVYRLTRDARQALAALPDAIAPGEVTPQTVAAPAAIFETADRADGPAVAVAADGARATEAAGRDDVAAALESVDVAESVDAPEGAGVAAAA